MSDSLCFELFTPAIDDRPVYISGNFCEWYPDVEAFRMTKIEDGKYFLKMPQNLDFQGVIEYKYTRGAWDGVELDETGHPPANRITRRKSGLRKDYVPHWRNEGRDIDPQCMPTVVVVSEDFEIPQLKRKRRVLALLPHDYDTSKKQYPVMYLQDAQNLFGQGSAFGNWEIDKKMAVLAARGHGDLIIVAIDHGNEDRKTEYNPYENRWLGKALGRKYAAFLARNLKPYIDKHFRTLPARQHTGIGGSSLGGLISVYAGLMFPEVFGRLMIFSPSLWVSSKIYFDAIEFVSPLPTKLYIYAGGKESSSMVASVQRMKETLENQGHDRSPIEINLHIDPKGKHHEERWGREFPKAIEWLFF